MEGFNLIEILKPKSSDFGKTSKRSAANSQSRSLERAVKEEMRRQVTR